MKPSVDVTDGDGAGHGGLRHAWLVEQLLASFAARGQP
jgi:hypothetical protein